MSPLKVTAPKLTLLGAVCVLASLAGGLTLLGKGSQNISVVVTLIIGPAIATLLTLYQAQLNGGKADVAAAVAVEAKDAAQAVASTTIATHTLLNGGLDARLIAAAKVAALAALEEHFGVPAQATAPAVETTAAAPPPFPVSGA